MFIYRDISGCLSQLTPSIFLSDFQNKIMRGVEERGYSSKLIIIDDGSNSSLEALFFLSFVYPLSNKDYIAGCSYNIVSRQSDLAKQRDNNAYLQRQVKNFPRYRLGVNCAIDTENVYHQLLSDGYPILTHIYYDNQSVELLAGIQQNRLLITVDNAELVDDKGMCAIMGNLTERDNWLILRYKSELDIPDYIWRNSMIFKNGFISTLNRN